MGELDRSESLPGRGSVLGSWKEIAAYLNRTVRTAQRWEQTEGLPVHRHSHEKRDSVYASPAEIDAWWTNRRTKIEGEERTGAVSPAEGQETALPVKNRVRGKWILAVATGVLIVLLAAGARYVAYGSASALGLTARDRVLITDFDNQTGDPLFDKSLLMPFTAGLEQSSRVNVLSRVQIESTLRRMGKTGQPKIDEGTAREICLREGVRGMISCGIAGDGRQYQLIARLVNPQNGEAVRSYVELASDRGQLLGAMDKLIQRVRRGMGESLWSVNRNSRSLPQVTTPSLQALVDYAQGNELWRKGKYTEAVALFEAAVRLDSDFAMAHAALGNAFLSHIYSKPAEGKAHYDRALLRPERLTERERLHIQVARATALGHYQEALGLHGVYVSTYPEDGTAHYGFGTLLMRRQQFEQALEQLSAAVRLIPNDAGARINLATCLKQMDRPLEALEAYTKAFELEPVWKVSQNLNHEYGFALVMAGQLGEAREVFQRAVAKNDTRHAGLRSLALLDMYEGKYRSARENLRQAILLTTSSDRLLANARNHLYLAILEEELGALGEAVPELDRARQALAAVHDAPVWLGARIATAYARAGRVGLADEMLAELKTRTDASSPDDASELSRAEGEAALARGQFESGLELLQQAYLAANWPLTVASLARGYDRAGDRSHANEYREKLVAMRGGALGWEPQQDWIAAHVELAGFYRSRGETALARRTLDSIATFRANADADAPITREIKQMQADLR